ncbi:MAG TPA: glycoside-pentoside-hexuronide (GPH):cation symporter [Arachnia sp.]|nr:glycoside-pentoside-hexuronide (GPH):cation symporter [Arachnia sp.]HMT85668.1 glycoside-pentoside-hexuronide (GPH):cation symporter [Arachnia sp.]
MTTGDRWGYGLGTLGRDMLAALVSTYLMFYLTDVLLIGGRELLVLTGVIVFMRFFDAVNDPVMGVIVDNTRTRWGKFKPWIAVGALAWAASGVLMFTDWGLTGWGFVAVFTATYIAFEISYTVNDIAYWGMLPSLTRDQRDREKVGAVARICANIGLFSVVVGIVPLTAWMGDLLGSTQRAWFVLAVAVAVLMLAFQSLTLLFARERVPTTDDATPLRELFRVIARNDQLLWVTLGMVAFMTGYITTTSLGLYYFKYVYGDEGMYPVFALVLGVTQLVALALLPAVSRLISRRTLHLVATVMIVVGYAVFWFSGTTPALVAAAGVLLFAGQAAIQLLLVMFIADSVEYGEWKLGRRNESVTFSLQPFVYKSSNALASGVVGVTLVVSGLDRATSAAEVTASGSTTVRLAMLVVPAALALASWAILRAKYRLDETTYARIAADLDLRHGR